MSSKEDLFKEEAINAGQKLFKQFGFHKTTMEDIASEMGKAKSTLYYYYKNKEEIFDAVVRKEMYKLREDVKKKVEVQKGIVDKLSTYCMEFYREVTNKTNLYKVIIKEITPTNLGQKYFSVLVDYEKKYMIDILEKSYNSGEHRLFEKEDLPLEAEIFLVAIFGIIQYSVEHESLFNESNLQKIIDRLLPRML